jgi:hypothetical protein
MARFGLLAVVMGVTMAFVVLIAGTAFFLHHHRSEKASAHAAEAEFQRLRARFADQRPLLEGIPAATDRFRCFLASCLLNTRIRSRVRFSSVTRLKNSTANLRSPSSGDHQSGPGGRS